jgi:hypothetical protein
VTTFDTGGVAVRFDNLAGNADDLDLKDDFSNAETTRWSVGGAIVKDGGYEVSAGPGIQSWQQPLPNGSSSVGDFALDVDATLVNGQGDGVAYGVMFGDGGSFDFYTLYLFPEGGIALFRSEAGGQSTTLIPPLPLELVKPGTNATNHIRLEVRGQTISIALNGTQLPDLQLDQPIRGMVGLIVSSGTTARFDDFQLEELAAKPDV